MSLPLAPPYHLRGLEHELGCCTDKRYAAAGRGGFKEGTVAGCNDLTCMVLPEGKACGDCYAFRHCEALYGATAERVYCDFFPRRFVLPVAQ